MIDKYIYILNVLEFVMDNGNLILSTQISSKTFLSSLLHLLKCNEHPDIQCKVLFLIEKWGIKYQNQKDVLPNFTETYIALKQNGVVFPKQPVNVNKKKIDEKLIEPIEEEKPINKILCYHDDYDYTGNNYGEINLDLDEKNYPIAYLYYVKELRTVIEYINIINEMIDNGNPNNVDESLPDLVEMCFNFGNTIQGKILDLEHEKLLGISIGINEDIIQVKERYNIFLNGKKPRRFISSFKEEYKQYNSYIPKKRVQGIPMVEENFVISPSNNNNPSNIDLIDFAN